MEADGGLVENIEDTAQTRADLGCEANALAFSAGKRSRAAIKREIAEADGDQEFQPLDNLALQAIGDELLALAELKLARGRKRIRQRQGGEVGNGKAVGGDGERFRTKALAVALRTDGRGHVTHEPLAIAVGANFIQRLTQPFQDAVKAGAGTFSAFGAIEEQFLLRLCELLEGLAQINFVAVGGEMNQLA